MFNIYKTFVFSCHNSFMNPYILLFAFGNQYVWHIYLSCWNISLSKFSKVDIMVCGKERLWGQSPLWIGCRVCPRWSHVCYLDQWDVRNVSQAEFWGVTFLWEGAGAMIKTVSPRSRSRTVSAALTDSCSHVHLTLVLHVLQKSRGRRVQWRKACFCFLFVFVFCSFPA